MQRSVVFGERFLYSIVCLLCFCVGRSDPEPTPRSDDAKENASEATQVGETPGLDAKIFEALDEDKSETSSPVE